MNKKFPRLLAVEADFDSFQQFLMCRRVSLLNLPYVSSAYTNVISYEPWHVPCSAAP